MRRVIRPLLLCLACLALTMWAFHALAGEREFTFERGPIRRELARIAAPAEGEREQEFREQRLHRYAWAVSDAAEAFPYPTRRDMVAALLAIGEHESHFDEVICEDFERAPAVGCWQWELESRPRAEAPRNVEDAASKAAKHLAWAWRKCGSFEGAVSLYATGKTCDVWQGAHKRVKSYTRIVSRL